ncbi:hypothetical protein D7X33_22410 [Butyricicoccus sp. 1XD8-22]|nr:hypothetical protein D7X33_22410 [Butyricicoccus sp. 1XD8-22]
MSIYKRNQEDIFNDFMHVKVQIQTLAGIVQNEGIEVKDEELNEWSDFLNEVVNDLQRLRLDVIEFYSNGGM